MAALSDWNEKQKELKEFIRKPDQFDSAKELFLSMHQSVHFSESYGNGETMMDKLWDGLPQNSFAVMPTVKDVTIAWNIWHITRIEDLTVNILVNRSEQILNSQWLEQLKTNVTDTGNAMTDDEIMDFSEQIDIDALKQYRIAVGQQTKNILSSLCCEDMKRKIEPERTQKILSEGGVLNHPDSVWLLDFWGKKDVAGIILMPVTRHQAVHLNDSFRLKQVMSKKKVFYRS